MKQNVSFTITLPWPDNMSYGTLALDGMLGQPFLLTLNGEEVAPGGIVTAVEVDPLNRYNYITVTREIEFDEPTNPLARLLMGLPT